MIAWSNRSHKVFRLSVILNVEEILTRLPRFCGWMKCYQIGWLWWMWLELIFILQLLFHHVVCEHFRMGYRNRRYCCLKFDFKNPSHPRSTWKRCNNPIKRTPYLLETILRSFRILMSKSRAMASCTCSKVISLQWNALSVICPSEAASIW